MSDYPPPPPPPPPGDGYPGAPAYGSAPKSNQKALWAMIAGIGSIVLCWCCPIIPLGLGGTAVFLGRSAKSEIAGSGGGQSGAGQAQAGFVCGLVGLALGVVSVVITIIAFSTGDRSFYYDFD